jgi:hypothetical protein
LADVTREEFQVLEREVEGEKMVTLHILEQTRRNGDDLAALKTRAARVEEKLDGLDRKVGGLDRKVDGMDGKFEGKIDALDRKITDLATALPRIVRDTMRKVLSEREQK